MVVKAIAMMWTSHVNGAEPSVHMMSITLAMVRTTTTTTTICTLLLSLA
jgi:hypothetical protein